MKLVFAFALLFAIGCTSTEKEAGLSMTGAYKMVSQSWKNEKTDTTITSLKQLKIFTDDFIMYANVNSPDSVSSFGIGTYTAGKDTVMETVIFSAGDSTRDDTARHYTLVIEKTAKGYKQVIPEIGTGENKVKLTEEYETAGTATKTSLDGAWKLIKAYTVKGKDTTANNQIQYKTYYAGYCAWGNSWTDSLNKNHTGIGWGKFEMNGNKVKESMIASTYSLVTGHDFEVDVELNGADEFKQTINNTDGTKNIEIYQRLKK